MRTLIMRRVAPGRRLAAFFLTVIALALTACGSTATIRDAQDEFSSAAKLDNASGLRSGEMPSVQPSTGELGSALAASRAAARSYERAHELVTSVIETDGAELQQNGLLVHALTLQAMCEWRLGRWNAAQTTAEKAQDAATANLGPRDKAVLEAMPGMIRNDQAFAMLQVWKAAGAVKKDEVAAAQDLLVGADGGALSFLETARTGAGKHPIAVYLVVSELAVLKNLNDVKFFAKSHGVVPPPTPDQTQLATELIDEFEKKTPPGDTRDELVKLWKAGLSL